MEIYERQCEAVVANGLTYVAIGYRSDAHCARSASEYRDGHYLCWQHAAQRRLAQERFKEAMRSRGMEAIR